MVSRELLSEYNRDDFSVPSLFPATISASVSARLRYPIFQLTNTRRNKQKNHAFEKKRTQTVSNLEDIGICSFLKKSASRYEYIRQRAVHSFSALVGIDFLRLSALIVSLRALQFVI